MKAMDILGLWKDPDSDHPCGPQLRSSKRQELIPRSPLRVTEGDIHLEHIDLTFKMIRSVLATGASFILTSMVFANAYVNRQQFYPSVVYITKSNSRYVWTLKQFCVSELLILIFIIIINSSS